jgi:hypothetical protein
MAVSPFFISRVSAQWVWSPTRIHRLLPISTPFGYTSREQRWNIVVFESYRVTELLLKGMMCLSGHTPKPIHDLDKLADRFAEILSRRRAILPFTCAIRDAKGNCYGVNLSGTTIELFSCIGGVYTQMARLRHRQLTLDEILRLKLTVSNCVVRLSLNNEEVIAHTDAAINRATKIQTGFVCHPDPMRLKQLRDAVRELRSQREAAFYTSKVYGEKEALRAIEQMNTMQEASSAFIAIDN